MIVFDHTHHAWRSLYDRHGRANGAFTYSKDICRWHLPIWREILSGDQSIATCGMVPGVTVQYLHERTQPRLDPRTRLFVTTYKDISDTLGPRGLWLPNLIDKDTMPSARPDRAKGWVYFGNLVGPKRAAVAAIEALRPVFVSGVKDQEAALSQVSQHRLGIGVGRCALEMMALGMPVMIFGKALGGLILSEEDFRRQSEANFNGNVTTGAASIEEAAAKIEAARFFPVTFQERIEEIRERIAEGWEKSA